MDNLAAFTFYVFYIVAMLNQIYLQCYFGSLAAHESEKALYALFSGNNWLETDLANRKLWCQFMVRLRKASKLTTMKVIAIDRGVFMSVSL